MRYLREFTATRITVGPFLDKTDGVTPKTGLTVTACHLTLMVDDGGVPTLVLDADATASGGNNDMVHVTDDNAGFYDLELAAAQLNYQGRAILAITDAANHCPVFHELTILPAQVYDSLILGSDLLDTADGATLAAIAALNNLTAAQVWAYVARTLSAFAFAPTPSNAADVTSILAYSQGIQGDVDDVKAVTEQLSFTVPGQVDANALTGAGGLSAAGVRAAVGLSSANLDTQLGDLPTNAELAASQAAADDAVLAAVAALNNITAADVWNYATRTLSNFGTLAVDVWAVSTRTLTGIGGLAADVWASGSRLLTGGDNIVLAKGTGITGFNDITAADVWAYGGRTLTSLGTLVADIWDRATSLLTTAGSIGKRLVDNVDAPISTISLGSGSVAWVVMVTDGSNPLDGVNVWATTDEAGSNVVARGYTNASGQVTLMLDPGPYYFWKQLAGFNFTNPQQDTVA